MGTVDRIAATANATAPATAQDRGSSTTRSSVFTRTRPSGPGRITPRASSSAVPNCSSARRARSRSISTQFTPTLPHYNIGGLAEKMKPVHTPFQHNPTLAHALSALVCRVPNVSPCFIDVALFPKGLYPC
jgi:hypothetical protein